MKLTASTYGKGRVRVMRVARGPHRHGVSELTLTVMLRGTFDRAYTHADNAAVIATDSIRNIVNIVARERLDAPPETFCRHLAARFLDRYPQIGQVTVDSAETRWTRLAVDGHPHPHAFLHDANGRPTVRLEQDRAAATLLSGIAGVTFLKSTGSGWTGYVVDENTTLAETTDRIAATAMTASWLWSAPPADPTAGNAAILDAMLATFATTYSHGLQDSLYRMAQAALAAEPTIDRVTLSCPNKHYLPIDLSPFGLSADGQLFVPTDEPHGVIECTVDRA